MTGYCPTPEYLVNRRWRSETGSWQGITYITSFIFTSGYRPRHLWLLLLSCLQAEIYVIQYPLPVTGRHLWLTAIFDIPLTLTSEFALVHFSRVPWPRKHAYIAVRIVLLSCVQAEIYIFHIHFRLQTAMFDLPVTLTSESICTYSSVMLLDHTNLYIVIGISLLLCTGYLHTANIQP